MLRGIATSIYLMFKASFPTSSKTMFCFAEEGPVYFVHRRSFDFEVVGPEFDHLLN